MFQVNGKLEGVTPAFGSEDFFLKSGYGKYLFGNDVIEFGPGRFEHDKVHIWTEKFIQLTLVQLREKDCMFI